MTRSEWAQHMEISSGLTRPSKDGDKEAWTQAARSHIARACPQCQARQKTQHRGAAARMRNQAMRDTGLTSYRNAAGTLQWESLANEVLDLTEGQRFYAYVGDAPLGKEHLGSSGRHLFHAKTVRGAHKHAKNYFSGNPYKLYTFNNFYDDKTFKQV